MVIAGPIWLGYNFSVTKQIVERRHVHCGQLKEQCRLPFCGRVGGALITGNKEASNMALGTCCCAGRDQWQRFGLAAPNPDYRWTRDQQLRPRGSCLAAWIGSPT